MGVGPAALTLYRDLAHHGILKPGSICELGSQDLVPENFELAPLFSAFGVPATPVSGSALDLMEALGFTYECIDLDGQHGARKLDLNELVVPQIDLNDPVDPPIFNVVTNHGTTEHVFDQANCFRLVHDLTAIDGLMIHVVPTRPYPGHGFYLYDANLFRDLAETNQYEIVRLYEWPDQFGVLLVVALKRQTGMAFRKPMQGVYRHLTVPQ